MLEYYKENGQFYLIILVWLLAGMFGGPVIFLVLPGTLVLMRQKGMWEELFLGFFFILIMSDSELSYLAFAKNIKIVYLVILAAFFILDMDEFRPLNGI